MEYTVCMMCTLYIVLESKVAASNLLDHTADAHAPMRTSLSSTFTHVSLGLAGPKELPPQDLPGEFWSLRHDHIILPAPNKGT